MANPLKSDTSMGLGLLAARVPVGVVLVYAGVTKIAYAGVEHFVSQHARLVPTYMPAWFGPIYLHAVPFAEVTLGLLLVAGFLTRLSGFLASLMLISFGVATGGLNAFFKPGGDTAAALLQPPAVYLAFALIPFFCGAGRVSVDRLLSGAAQGKARVKPLDVQWRLDHEPVRLRGGRSCLDARSDPGRRRRADKRPGNDSPGNDSPGNVSTWHDPACRADLAWRGARACRRDGAK